MDTNNVILSYHESLLRKSDVELLKGPCWLNDTVISFYFEYLEINKFKSDPMLLFVPPQVTQCIKVSPSNEIGIFLDPLNSHNKDFIFFALNDNEQTECSGGSHWSLLVFSYPERAVYHYDSSRGSNQHQAYEFANKLFKFYGMIRHGNYNEPDCLQQTNGYDCGVHVLCNTENIANYALIKRRIEGCPTLDRHNVSSKRNEILDLIHILRRNSMNNK
ncbi:sentrin-specific protease 8-like isoform X2 [Onthophagus taurus]